MSFTFGPDVVSKFLSRHDMDLICRAHQVVEDGYEFFAKRQLVTLFSAPNYCGEFDNAGGMMSVDETLMCSFQVINSLIPSAVRSYRPDGIRPMTTHNIYRFPFTCSLTNLADPQAVREESEIPIQRDDRARWQAIYPPKEPDEKEMTTFR